jgi:hypothetical protein
MLLVLYNGGQLRFTVPNLSQIHKEMAEEVRFTNDLLVICPTGGYAIQFAFCKIVEHVLIPMIQHLLKKGLKALF